MADSTVTIVGNLVRAPELRFTTGGSALANMGVAVSKRYKGKDDKWVETTSFFNVVAWGDLAEHAAQSLEKGARVIVTGSLEQRNYETAEGEKRNVVEIKADAIGPDLRWANVVVERITREKQYADDRSEDSPTQEPF